MWSIQEHNTKATKVIDKAPKQVQEKYTYWKQVVKQDGPEALRKISGFHDEALSGKWEGRRSSRLNNKYRVIYRIEKNIVTVLVEQIGPHDY